MMTRRLVHLVVACLMVGVAGPSEGQDSIPDVPEIRTSGTARRTVRPDWATVTLQFHETDSTPAATMRRLSRRTATVHRALRDLGIPPDSLVIGSRRTWWRGRIETLPFTRCVTLPDRPSPCVSVADTNYRIRESVEVRIHDIGLVGQVIDTAFAQGITEIMPVRFAASDLTTPEDEALREATRRAREKAEIIAAESGGSLGGVIWLGTEPERPPVKEPSGGVTITFPTTASEFVTTATAIRGGRGAAGTEITAPSVVVTVTVYGRWRLEPSP